MTVIPFKRDDPVADRSIWVCGCGCQSFRLNEDATIECCVCGGTCACNSEWRNLLPDKPETIPRDTGGTIIVSAVGSPELAKRRVLKNIETWMKAGELEVLCAYHTDGTGSHWLNLETEEDKACVLKKISDMAASVEATDIGR